MAEAAAGVVVVADGQLQVLFVMVGKPWMRLSMTTMMKMMKKKLAAAQLSEVKIVAVHDDVAAPLQRQQQLAADDAVQLTAYDAAFVAVLGQGVFVQLVVGNVNVEVKKTGSVVKMH